MPSTETVGQKFGRLTVISETAPRMNQCGKRKRMVIARCDCGTERHYQLGNLKSGNSRSCGCYDSEVLAARNAESAKPQAWTVDGAVAFIEINDTKVLVDAADVQLVGLYRWHIDDNGYVDSAQCNPMHRLILGLERGDTREGDHVHHMLTDNRRSQLRIATSSQNKMNRRSERNSTSIFKGVDWDSARGKWRAQIQSIFLGRFDSEDAAAAAYDTAALKRFGEFAHLNFTNDRGAQHA